MYIVTESTQRNMGPNSSNLPCVYTLQDQCVHLCMSYLNEDCQMGPKHNEKKKQHLQIILSVCPFVDCSLSLPFNSMHYVYSLIYAMGDFLTLETKE